MHPQTGRVTGAQLTLWRFKVVAGIIGYYLHQFSDADVDAWPQARWIYTEVVAGLSILLGLIWLIPFSFGFFSWPCMSSFPALLRTMIPCR